MEADFHNHNETNIFYIGIAGPAAYVPQGHSPNWLFEIVKGRVRQQKPSIHNWFDDAYLAPQKAGTTHGMSPWSGFKVPDEEVLKFYFEYFDNIFFHSSLKNRCELRLEDYPDEEKSLETDTYTIRAFTMEDGNIFSIITIHTIPTLYDRKERITAYMSILLHEMIRVFLMTFTCRHPYCLYQIEGRCRTGGLGFGYIWQDMAFELETQVYRLMGLKLDLFRNWAWAVNHRLSGRKVTEMDDSRWGFSPMDLVAVLRVIIPESSKGPRSFLTWAREQNENVKRLQKQEERLERETRMTQQVERERIQRVETRERAEAASRQQFREIEGTDRQTITPDRGTLRRGGNASWPRHNVRQNRSGREMYSSPPYMRG